MKSNALDPLCKSYSSWPTRWALVIPLRRGSQLAVRRQSGADRRPREACRALQAHCTSQGMKARPLSPLAPSMHAARWRAGRPSRIAAAVAREKPSSCLTGTATWPARAAPALAGTITSGHSYSTISTIAAAVVSLRPRKRYISAAFHHLSRASVWPEAHAANHYKHLIGHLASSQTPQPAPGQAALPWTLWREPASGIQRRQ